MQEIIFHTTVFIVAAAIIFLFGGILVEATNRIAKRLHRNGFVVAFVLLGTLTSLSEISVAFNATLKGVPQVSAGNLVGASFVIFLLIVPFLAFFGNGIRLQNSLTKKNLLLALFVIGSPAIFVFDGMITRSEGAVMVILYLLLLYYTKISSPIAKVAGTLEKAPQNRRKLYTDALKVLAAAVLIFLSGRLIVEEAVYFSTLLRIPSSFIGLILIAIGTNVPEFVIAIRAVRQKHKSIAFGDYVGSAAFNTITLGALVLANGAFAIEINEFLLTAIFLVIGLVLFYLFSRSKYDISRIEGMVLGLIYIAFVIAELLIVSQMTPVF